MCCSAWLPNLQLRLRSLKINKTCCRCVAVVCVCVAVSLYLESISKEWDGTFHKPPVLNFELNWTKNFKIAGRTGMDAGTRKIKLICGHWLGGSKVARSSDMAPCPIWKQIIKHWRYGVCWVEWIPCPTQKWTTVIPWTWTWTNGISTYCPALGCLNLHLSVTSLFVMSLFVLFVFNWSCLCIPYPAKSREALRNPHVCSYNDVDVHSPTKTLSTCDTMLLCHDVMAAATSCLQHSPTLSKTPATKLP